MASSRYRRDGVPQTIPEVNEKEHEMHSPEGRSYSLPKTPDEFNQKEFPKRTKRWSTGTGNINMPFFGNRTRAVSENVSVPVTQESNRRNSSQSSRRKASLGEPETQKEISIPMQPQKRPSTGSQRFIRFLRKSSSSNQSQHDKEEPNTETGGSSSLPVHVRLTRITGTSMFKQLPGESKDNPIYVLAEDYGNAFSPPSSSSSSSSPEKAMSEEEKNRSQELQIQKMSSSRHPEVAIHLPGKRHSSQTSPKKIKYTLTNSISTGKYQHKINELWKEVESGEKNVSWQESFLPILKPKKKRYRGIWTSLFSFTNVVVMIHAVILILMTILVALVTTQAGSEALQETTMAITKNTFSNLLSQLGSLIVAAENTNVFTEALVTFHEIGVQDSITCTNVLYYLLRKQDVKMDKVYILDGIYNCGAESNQDRYGYKTKTYSVFLVNKTTAPDMWIYPVPPGPNCNFAWSCDFPQRVFGNPNLTHSVVQNAELSVNEYLFNIANMKRRRCWTGVWGIEPGEQKVTSLRPIYNGTSATGLVSYVSATDVVLTTISNLLHHFNQVLFVNLNLNPNTTSQDIAFLIFQNTTNKLIATSNLSIYDQPMNSPIDLSLTDPSDPRFQPYWLASTVFNNFVDLDTDIQIQVSRNNFVAAAFFSSPNSNDVLEDLQWIVVGYFPAQVFTATTTTYILGPIVFASILIACILVSVVITKAIGKPLREMAKQIMRISDLDLDVIYGDRKGGDSRRSSLWDSNGTVNQDSNQQSPLPSSSLDSVSHHWYSCLTPSCPSLCPSFCSRLNLRPGDLKELKYIRKAMISLNSSLRSFVKYVPMEIVSLIIKMNREAVLGADEAEITIFFSDIADFTSISEKLSPKELVELMSEYLDEMSSIIIHSDGIVDKYIGDAIMAFWNAPLLLEQHPYVACIAALKSQSRLKQLRAEWVSRGFPPIHSRMGIHTGIAVVGNIGSPNRFNYTCLGDSVNLASRLEGLNKYYNTDIIISEQIYQQIKDRLVCRVLDIVSVKGKHIPVKIYELIESYENVDEATLQLVQLYTTAFQRYVEARFEEAAVLLSDYLRKVPQDVPANMLKDRCEALLQQGPLPPGWKGVVELQKK